MRHCIVEFLGFGGTPRYLRGRFSKEWDGGGEEGEEEGEGEMHFGWENGRGWVGELCVGKYFGGRGRGVKVRKREEIIRIEMFMYPSWEKRK